MTLKKHKNNEAWWHAKNGDASSEQVAEFARGYQRYDAAAWTVCVAEGADWIAAHPVAQLMAHTRGAGTLAVWISDGHRAQVVWRKGGLPAWRDPAAEMPDDKITVAVRMKYDDEAAGIGYHDGDDWHLYGYEPGCVVTGWMHVHEAAQILDAATRGEVLHG